MADERHSIHIRRPQRSAGGTEVVLGEAAGEEKPNGRRLQLRLPLAAPAAPQRSASTERLLVLPQSCPIVGTARQLAVR